MSSSDQLNALHPGLLSSGRAELVVASVLCRVGTPRPASSAACLLACGTQCPHPCGALPPALQPPAACCCRARRCRMVRPCALLCAPPPALVPSPFGCCVVHAGPPASQLRHRLALVVLISCVRSSVLTRRAPDLRAPPLFLLSQTCKSCGRCSICCCPRYLTTRRCLQSGLGRPSPPHRCAAGMLPVARKAGWEGLPPAGRPQRQPQAVHMHLATAF